MTFTLDKFRWVVDNVHMSAQAIDKQLERYIRHSEKFRREIKADPEKAKEFLIRAGIAVRDSHAPSGVQLAERFR